MRIVRIDRNTRLIPPRADDDWLEPPMLSTATTVIEYDPEPLGVLVCDHRGNPLIARVKDPIGFRLD